MEISSQEMQDLRETLQKEKEIIQAVISDGFCVLDPFWKIASLNTTATKLLCCSNSNFIGKLFYEVFILFEEKKDELSEISLEKLQEKCAIGEIYHCEKGRIKTFQGVDHPVSFSINPLPLINDKLFGGAVLIFRDISKQIETENLLKSSLKAAQESNLAKAQFLANMSHEIRTPMNGVLGMLQLLMHTPLDDAQTNYAKKCFDSANSLLRIIGDILDFSKIEAGKVNFENKQFNLKEELNSLLIIYLAQAKEKNIAIDLIIDDEIPSAVNGDAFRIRQIMNNLVNNALKFTPENGKISIEVTLKSAYMNKIVLQFSVKDNGIGIKEEMQSKIFEAFSQADESTTREYGGTGLGLAICKHLVSLMGGEIAVTSMLGTGSRFTFTLVLDKAENKPSLQAQKPTLVHVPQFQANILVVEDNLMNQSVLCDMLKTLGCHTNVAPSGSKAIDAIKKDKYDLIFMDCHMPGMDGFVATQKIRELQTHDQNNKLIIVALTADTLKGTKEHCLSVGMDDYLTKPINYSHLCTVLSKHL
ncbi:MAG: ATP-binding protein [Candidatus Berkiella sp.]